MKSNLTALVFHTSNCAVKYPTNPLTILEPQDQEIGELYAVQERRATDFEAKKL